MLACKKRNLKFKVFNSIGIEGLTLVRFVNEGLQTECIDIGALISGI